LNKIEYSRCAEIGFEITKDLFHLSYLIEVRSLLIEASYYYTPSLTIYSITPPES
jgi:hypothetical protein